MKLFLFLFGLYEVNIKSVIFSLVLNTFLHREYIRHRCYFGMLACAMVRLLRRLCLGKFAPLYLSFPLFFPLMNRQLPLQLARQKSVIVLLFCLIFGFASCKEDTVEPAPQTGQIVGQVVDASNGAVLSNVSVTTSPATISVTTDTEGKFVIESVPVGRVTITSKKTGYQQSIVSVTVLNAQAAAATIQLEKNVAAQPPKAPTRPNPADRSVNQPLTRLLSWHPNNPLSDSIRYDVILYKSGSTDRLQLLSSRPDTSVTVTGLQYNTLYFWQVTARNNTGSIARSEVWSFQTGSMPEMQFLYVRQENGNTDIYAANANRRDSVRLTTSPFVETAPRLSPQQFDRIAYTSNVSGQYRLYTMNRDGSDQRMISQLPVEGRYNSGIGYCWSPDGSQLIFANNDRLYRVNRDGFGITLLSTAPLGYTYRECDWNGSTNQIIVQALGNRYVGDGIYDSEIYIMNADGSNRRLLLSSPAGGGRLDSPSFNIAGNRIMYTKDVNRNIDQTGRQTNAQIFTQNLDGSDVVAVSIGPGTINTGKPNGFNDILPRFSGNNGKIVFVSVSNVNQSIPEVWQMDPDGRNRVRLFQNATLPDAK